MTHQDNGDTPAPGKDGSESSGGAYPNPHSGKKPGRHAHGGQTGQAYHGTGQLGEQSVGENENAVTEND